MPVDDDGRGPELDRVPRLRVGGDRDRDGRIEALGETQDESPT